MKGFKAEIPEEGSTTVSDVVRPALPGPKGQAPTTEPPITYDITGRVNPYVGNESVISSVSSGQRPLGLADDIITGSQLQKIGNAGLEVKVVDTIGGKQSIIYDPSKTSGSDINNLVDSLNKAFDFKSQSVGERIQSQIDLGKALKYSDADIKSYLYDVAINWKGKFSEPPWTVEDINSLGSFYTPKPVPGPSVKGMLKAGEGSQLVGGSGSYSTRPPGQDPFATGNKSFNDIADLFLNRGVSDPGVQAKIQAARDAAQKQIEIASKPKVDLTTTVVRDISSEPGGGQVAIPRPPTAPPKPFITAIPVKPSVKGIDLSGNWPAPRGADTTLLDVIGTRGSKITGSDITTTGKPFVVPGTVTAPKIPAGPYIPPKPFEPRPFSPPVVAPRPPTGPYIPPRPFEPKPVTVPPTIPFVPPIPVPRPPTGPYIPPKPFIPEPKPFPVPRPPGGPYIPPKPFVPEPIKIPVPKTPGGPQIQPVPVQPVPLKEPERKLGGFPDPFKYFKPQLEPSPKPETSIPKIPDRVKAPEGGRGIPLFPKFPGFVTAATGSGGGSKGAYGRGPVGLWQTFGMKVTAPHPYKKEMAGGTQGRYSVRYGAVVPKQQRQAKVKGLRLL